ncbi:MAG: hypothetical protein ABGZ17_18620 [Planctomycetaceae bacterium]
MLQIGTDILPCTDLTYFAFRVAFQSTFERIVLSRQVDEDAGHFGFLTEVPFLCAVPAQVQLDVLAETWQKHVSDATHQATLVDESVVYAVCEASAAIVEHESYQIAHYLDGGPTPLTMTPDHFLASELRSLHLGLSNEGDFLMISQFEDMDPMEAQALKRTFDLDLDRLNALFEVLGRWHLLPEFAERLSQLLSDKEVVKVLSLFPVRQPSE